MLGSNYPDGFNRGISIRNIPIDVTLSANAKVFHVHNVLGLDSNDGSPRYPFASIAYAVSKCNSLPDSNGDPMVNGDRIRVLPGHVETVSSAAALTIDKTGIVIEFLGEGTSRGQILFDTVTTASMAVTAPFVLINPQFVTGIDALSAPVTFSTTADGFKIYGAEWYDAPAMAATNGLVIASGCNSWIIDGYKYYASTTGTQKVSHISYADCANPTLANIDIVGDFSTANIYGTAASTNEIWDNIYLRNTNATPKPGVNQHANTTGMWNNVFIRIASGTSYVSSVAKINYSDTCLGFNSDGKGGNPLGGADDNSVEGEIRAIQTDIGDPSARTNFSSLETMIGVPDAVNSSLDDMIRTGYDSTAIVSNANGSLMEQTKTVNTNLGDPSAWTSTIKTIADALGDPLVVAGANIPLFAVIPQVAKIDSGALISAPTAGSLASFIATGGVALGTQLAASKSLVDAIGSDGTTVATNATSIGGLLKTNNASTVKIDGATLAVSPTAGSLARFIASGGTALGTQLADSKSLVDAIGSNGSTLNYGAGSALAAKGTSFWLFKTVISSNVLAGAPVDITGVSSVGSLIIEEVIVMTDGTGLAGGTNFTMLSDNTKGKLIFFSETVLNLGGSKTISFKSASLVGQPFMLETGKKLQVQSTGFDCTGNGTMDIFVKCTRVDAGATIAVL